MTSQPHDFTVPADADDRPVVVIGAGTLGRRIAAVFASGGTEVCINDLSAEQRDAAVEYASGLAHELNGKLGDNGADVRPGTVTAVDDLAVAVTDAWLVIEAVPERLDIKTPLFGQLDRLAPTDALLATNSSSYASRLVVDEVTRPERVFNMHFAMPPASMAVELMSDGQTAPGLLQGVADTLRRYGLLPFIAHRESTGFIFNRIWAAIKRESLDIVATGVSTPADVDAIMAANTGGSGPFRQMDAVGLDIVLDIEEHYAAENPHLPDGPRQLLREYVEAGKLGVKTGEGFFSYEK